MQGKGFRAQYVVLYIQNIGIRALPLLKAPIEVNGVDYGRYRIENTDDSIHSSIMTTMQRSTAASWNDPEPLYSTSQTFPAPRL